MRLEYLLRLEGAAPAEPSSRSAHVPPALLEEVFTLNETLDSVRDLRASGAPAAVVAARLEEARQPIEQKRAAHEADLHALAARWDALVETGASERERQAVLAALRERLLEHNYIRNLLDGIERELTVKGATTERF